MPRETQILTITEYWCLPVDRNVDQFIFFHSFSLSEHHFFMISKTKTKNFSHRTWTNQAVIFKWYSIVLI